jgi:hypothetical protein
MEVRADGSSQHPANVADISIKHLHSFCHIRHSLASLISERNWLQEANFHSANGDINVSSQLSNEIVQIHTTSDERYLTIESEVTVSNFLNVFVPVF